MKLNKEQEQEVLLAYNAYWDSYLGGDMETMDSLMDPDFTVIGSTEGEVFLNKKEAMKFYSATAGQIAGTTQLRNRKISIEPIDNVVLFIEQSDIYILIDGEWGLYAKGRVSSFLRKTKIGWKFIHQHGSLPDTKANEGEQIAIEKISKENLELRDAVKRRTIELENKNHELEIETALERVRAVAMGMKESADMLDVCRVISKQLESLNIKEIRNVQTAIFYESKGIYLNYEFFPLYDKTTITEIEYNLQPDVKAFATQMLSGPEAFFTADFTGAKLKDWIEYQKKADHFVDPHLPGVTSLHYYFYSIGPGALGISTYAPLHENDIAVFKRFRNVFELAYRRFIDIEQAHIQAREAQIEAALEKVRSRTMAMQKSDEFMETAAILFDQLRQLGEHIERAIIGVVNEEEHVMDFWATRPDGTEMDKMQKFPIDEPIVMKKVYGAWRQQKKSIVIDLRGEELENYFQFLKARSPRLERKSFGERRVENFAFFSKGILGVISADPTKPANVQLYERFAAVLDQTYTRFLDLQKAEAQAREAQIEAALERVRSRAMAMRKTDELLEAAELISKELSTLGIAIMNVSYAFVDEEEKYGSYFSLNPVNGKIPPFPFVFPHTETDVMRSILESWKKQEPFNMIELDEEATLTHQTWIGEHIHNLIIKNNLDIPFSVGAFLEVSPKKAVIYTFNFKQGYLFIIGGEHLTQNQEEMILRFTKVFDMTYRRFLDIKLAEANAEKAQVEELKLREEKKRSDALLLNILPEEIATELKLYGKSYARKHEEVTILFSDIKGFSTISEDLSAEELVTQLDECFRAFDKIIEKHGLEKIKTVGDAYICACGLPTPVIDNAIKTVKAAMDMLDFLKGFNVSKKIQDLPAFEFRIGIHTGPVVTGVVGLKKFTYDIWGDAVNMAARMEQHGEPGRINVSGNTYQRIQDKVTCTHRGKIPAKNKGEVDMYFVESIS